jgi:hypothetical protein
MAISNPSPERFPVISFVGAGADLVFWEKVDMKMQRVKNAVIGDPHWDTKNYPHHRLVYKTPHDRDGDWHKYFYAADRENQDDYNFEFSAGQQLVRSYVIPRDKYFARNATEAAAAVPLVEDEFIVPPVATLDSRFSKFGFADDTLDRTETELDFIYVVVRRRFIEPITSDVVFNDELDANVTITKELVPKGTTAPTPVAGQLVEIRNGNVFHDVKITQSVASTTNRTLPSIPAFINFNFPSRLDSVNIRYVSVYADSTEAAPSYNEDYYFEYKITEPKPGPYPAIVERIITANPNSVISGLSLGTLPVPRRETVGIVYYWWTAGVKGNQTQAVAREIEIPSTIHGEINITVNGSTPGGLTPAFAGRLNTTTLTATNGHTLLNGLVNAPVNADVRKLPLGLYEVRITKLNVTGIYGTP